MMYGIGILSLVSVRLNKMIFSYQGITLPAYYAAWGEWAPPMERSVLLSFQFSAYSVGSFVTLPIAGLIADTLGWEAVFYVTGIANTNYSTHSLLYSSDIDNLFLACFSFRSGFASVDRSMVCYDVRFAGKASQDFGSREELHREEHRRAKGKRSSK